MKHILIIKPSHDQPFTLEYTDKTGRTLGAPSYLEAMTEEEAREELEEEHGYSEREIDSLFNN